MKLYKFKPLGNCKDLCRIKKIIDEGFYCSDFLSFNDMNEGGVSIDIQKCNEKLYEKILNEKLRYKICSFSGVNALNSQLMWGHYANAGMGVAIEIESENCKDIEEIHYSDEEIYYSDEEIHHEDNVKKFLSRKSKEWRYENEYRFLIKDEILSKEKYKITKIIFGTPYRELLNCNDIIKKNEKLQKYLKYFKLLHEHLQQHDNIEPKCYNFKTKSIKNMMDRISLEKYCHSRQRN